MSTDLKLTVNGVQIPTDYFVKEFTEHTVIGMMGGLKDTGDIRELHFSIREGAVSININRHPIPVNEFASRIIISTIEGMLKPMKGVTFPVKTVEVTILK